MQDFSYECKTKIIFGKDTEKLVGEEIKKHANKVLLHYGQGSIKKIGLYDSVIESLNNFNIEIVELSGVVPNPRLNLVKQGIELCRKENIKFILAVGGGSVIDSAKAIAAGVPYKGDVWNLFSKAAELKEALPVATVLTIPAAGSEASPASVVTKEDENRKLAIVSDLLRPMFSILNPKLTFSLPAYQTAAGITDMIAHILERYFTNTKHVDVTDKLCEALLKSIIKNARLVLDNPTNYDYRAEIMLAGMLAHNGILGTGREEDWATHKIEHELSAFYDITHGAGLAIIFPAWMKYTYKHDIAKFIQYANNVWGIEGNDEETALLGIKSTKAFFKSIGMPTSLNEVDIGQEHFEKMAKLCGPVGNFVKLEAKDIVEIYKLAL